MSPEQRHYLFVQSSIGSAIINAIINGGLGWAATRGFPEVPVWKIPGVAADLVGTAFGVSFGTGLGAVVQVKIDTKKGRITAPTELSAGLARLMAMFPQKIFRRSVAVGVVSVPLFAPPVLIALAILGMPALERATFIAVKAGFSAVEGAIVTPLIVLATLLYARDVRPAS